MTWFNSPQLYHHKIPQRDRGRWFQLLNMLAAKRMIISSARWLGIESNRVDAALVWWSIPGYKSTRTDQRKMARWWEQQSRRRSIHHMGDQRVDSDSKAEIQLHRDSCCIMPHVPRSSPVDKSRHGRSRSFVRQLNNLKLAQQLDSMVVRTNQCLTMYWWILK